MIETTATCTARCDMCLRVTRYTLEPPEVGGLPGNWVRVGLGVCLGEARVMGGRIYKGWDLCPQCQDILGEFMQAGADKAAEAAKE